VGFRPFVYRLAREAGLAGWVMNTASGVTVEAEGSVETLTAFLEDIRDRKPPLSTISRMDHRWLPPASYDGFEIRKSSAGGTGDAVVLPDIVTCPDCLAEIMDPANRRYRYPFANCTNCGPRYSIITALPYDRASTTMAGFTMCPECRREYEDPSDRRFHAQPNACPTCGPRLGLLDRSGTALRSGEEALRAAVEALRDGEVVAVKGLGGFHLMCLASSDGAVARLRRGKRRTAKPFALMYPSLDAIGEHCRISGEEERILRSPRGPIVLLHRLAGPGRAPLSSLVAPGLRILGAMLPSTPLHHLILGDLGVPVVATSGNLSEEPICTDETEAVGRLSEMAELFLVHDRPIRRHVDDSIVRVVGGRPFVTRRARGYAPLPVSAPVQLPAMLGVGAHLKNTLAVSIGPNVFTSQHIGDLETVQAVEAFDEVLDSVTALFGTIPRSVARDLHPDYVSSAKADSMGIPVSRIQHHAAHVASCMLDNEQLPPVIGIAWDGTGLGTDGTVWGGETFAVGRETMHRAASLRGFRLPGGEAAVREPRRSALGLLAELFRDPIPRMPPDAFAPGEAVALLRMVSAGINSPRTSSMGRLFDAMASLTGLRQVMEYEGEAAVLLEQAAEGRISGDPYPAPLIRDPRGLLVMDWEPMVRAVLADIEAGTPTGEVSSRFHGALVGWITAIASALCGETRKVVLSGGCFQNALLLESAASALEDAGFEPVLHRELPPNDGGIAPGQIYAAACLPPLD